MAAIVGIPRGLLFYEYYPWYRTLLEGLGAEVVVSPDTSKYILDQGVEAAVDEACLPVKIFFGHVSHLKDKVDHLFIPRMVSVCPYEYTCPKLLGLPDMVKAGFAELPSVIDATLDLSKRASQVHEFVSNIAKALGQSPGLAEASLKKANEVFAKYRKMLRKGIPFRRAVVAFEEGGFRDDLGLEAGEGGDPPDSRGPKPTETSSNGQLASADGQTTNGQTLRIALMGHNYLLFDKQVGLAPSKHLETLGARIVTPDMVNEADV